jgi:hypothetical protein
VWKSDFPAVSNTLTLFHFSCLETRSSKEELRKPRNNPACGGEATDPRGSIGGENANPAALQRELHSWQQSVSF